MLFLSSVDGMASGKNTFTVLVAVGLDVTVSDKVPHKYKGHRGKKKKLKIR